MSKHTVAQYGSLARYAMVVGANSQTFFLCQIFTKLISSNDSASSNGSISLGWESKMEFMRSGSFSGNE